MRLLYTPTVTRTRRGLICCSGKKKKGESYKKQLTAPSVQSCQVKVKRGRNDKDTAQRESRSRRIRRRRRSPPTAPVFASFRLSGAAAQDFNISRIWHLGSCVRKGYRRREKGASYLESSAPDLEASHITFPVAHRASPLSGDKSAFLFVFPKKPVVGPGDTLSWRHCWKHDADR